VSCRTPARGRAVPGKHARRQGVAEKSPEAHKLNPRQLAFIREYALDLNATQAAIRAGYSMRTANEQGACLLAKPSIAAAIARAQAARAEATGITAEAVLRELWAIASADASELCEFRRVPCRYCHGKAHRYQFTPAELERERKDWSARVAKMTKREAADAGEFDEQGGIGYTTKREPHPACPECFGEGLEKPYFHDTRTLSFGARRLYAGVKTTKDGIEIKTHSRADALVKVGEHLGMFRDKEPPRDAAELARQVREAVRAMADADGLAA